jgi:hypothetical protein
MRQWERGMKKKGEEKKMMWNKKKMDHRKGEWIT